MQEMLEQDALDLSQAEVNQLEIVALQMNNTKKINVTTGVRALKRSRKNIEMKTLRNEFQRLLSLFERHNPYAPDKQELK